MCQITRWYYASVGSNLVTPPWPSAFARDHTLEGATSRRTDSYGTGSSIAASDEQSRNRPIADNLSCEIDTTIREDRGIIKTRTSTFKHHCLQWIQVPGTHTPRLQVPLDTKCVKQSHTHACMLAHPATSTLRLATVQYVGSLTLGSLMRSGFNNQPASGWHPLYSSEVLDLQSPSTFQLALVGRAW